MGNLELAYADQKIINLELSLHYHQLFHYHFLIIVCYQAHFLRDIENSFTISSCNDYL